MANLNRNVFIVNNTQSDLSPYYTEIIQSLQKTGQLPEALDGVLTATLAKNPDGSSPNPDGSPRYIITAA